MRGTDPTPASTHETEATHEDEHTAAFAALSEQIDDIIAGDTEGKMSRANKSPYPEGYPHNHEVVEQAVGDRYGQRVARTVENVYSAAYTTKVKPPQPIDDGKAGYNPYDFLDTRYQWHINDAGELDHVSKNGHPLDAEVLDEAVKDIDRTISEGLESGELTADAIPEDWHASRDYYSPSAAARKANLPVAPEAAPVRRGRAAQLLGKLGAVVGLGPKKQ